MAVTDWKYAGTAANINDGGARVWSSPDGAKAAGDSSSAIALFAKSEISQILRVTNFGFSFSDIPSGSTIDGIEVICNRWPAWAGNIYDNILSCFLTSAEIGSNLASASTWSGGPADYTYGDATNKWGWTPTQANILDSSFGLDLKVTNNNNAGGVNAYVDYLKIRVYYTAGGAGSIIPHAMKHYRSLRT